MSEGWTINKLATELGLDRRSLSARLKNLQPHHEVTRANGATVRHYSLKSVFTHLCGHREVEDSPASARARLDRLRGDLVELDLAAKRRELIPVVDFERAMASAFKLVASELENLPSMLERDAGLSGAAIERAIMVVDRLRDQLYQRLGSE